VNIIIMFESLINFLIVPKFINITHISVYSLRKKSI